MKTAKRLVTVIMCIAAVFTFVLVNWSKGEANSNGVVSGIAVISGNGINQERESAYNINKYGETYGEINSDIEEEPDLIAVIATTNGKEGYIKQSELNEKAGGNVSSPEEAVEYEKNSAGKTIKLPVYNKDGDRVIGFFEILPGETEEISTNVPNDMFGIMPLDYSMSAKKTVKGYKYSYYVYSAVLRHDSGKYKGECQGAVRITKKGSGNVPTGYLGGMARLYNVSNRKLVISSRWAYNSVPIQMKTILTQMIKGNGKYYYSESLARIYNGNGYDTYVCNRSPNTRVLSTDVDGYRVNTKGESYGSALDGEFIGGDPDLIEAVGIGGVEGYVRAADFEIENDTPKEAGENSPANGESDNETIPLYDKEGFVIGKFKIQTNVEESTADFCSENEKSSVM